MSQHERSYEGTAIAKVEFDREALPAPPETRYAPVVTFDDIEDGSAWSIGMECLTDLDEEGWVKLAHVDLLADEAPHHKMVRGATFDISEGPIKVGTVEVRVSSARLPEGDMCDQSSKEAKPRARAA